MQPWAIITTAIGDLFALAAAVINLVAAVQSRPRPGTGVAAASAPESLR